MTAREPYLAERPVRPEPSECPKIKKAMRYARFWNWTAKPLSALALLVSAIVGVKSSYYLGVGLFFAIWSVLYLVCRFTARCPRCGKAWSEDETETYVCSTCRVDIGFAFREK